MDSKMKKWIPLGVIIGAVLIIVGVLAGGYNGLNSKKNDVEASWSQVENVMQRRYDLIPNLVSSVKGQMKHETDVFTAIADARKQYSSATKDTDKLAADEELGKQTQILVNAVTENYPDLASSESVKTLMTQLEGSENRISTERRRYIDTVNDYNKQVTSFPNNMTAGMFGFSKMEVYHADTAAQTAPKVDLGQ